MQHMWCIHYSYPITRNPIYHAPRTTHTARIAARQSTAVSQLLLAWLINYDRWERGGRSSDAPWWWRGLLCILYLSCQHIQPNKRTYKMRIILVYMTSYILLNNRRPQPPWHCYACILVPSVSLYWCSKQSLSWYIIVASAEQAESKNHSITVSVSSLAMPPCILSIV